MYGVAIHFIILMNYVMINFTSEPLIPYYVKLAAYTVKGRGPYSDTAVNFTQEGGLLIVCKSNV